MPDKKPSVINIALVGGGEFCKTLLEKASFASREKEVNARFVAVADTDPRKPGMRFARQRGLVTVSDYHQLYEPRYDIHLIIIIDPDPRLFNDILNSRPYHIRILSPHVFELFWNVITLEESKLRARNEEVETILNGIQDFILVITPDMKIVEANETFLKKMGYTPEEVIQHKCHEVFEKTDKPCETPDLVCPLKDVVRNKKPTRLIRTREGPDGQTRYFEVNVYPVWEKDGKISKFIHISRDITQRKKEEQEITRRLERMVEERTRQLKETHDKLLHQDKMASLGKLSASVVHEINNPIAGILNLTKLIKRILSEGNTQEKDFDQFGQYLDLMETETKRISRIVSNLLAFSRLSKMELNRLNLNRLVEKTLFLNANLLKINGVKVEKHLDKNLPDIVGSEDQIQQVFMNIVSNVSEAIEPVGQGTLTITTQYDLKDATIWVRFKDTGIGIPKKNLSKLFEPFFTTKKKGKGIGLGLSVAYGIVEEHGGSIHVLSEVDKGTTFDVILPLKPKSRAVEKQGGVSEQH